MQPKAMQQCKVARATKDQSRLASIRNILMLGKKLRTDEMDYIQRHDPNLLYQARANAIQEAHREFVVIEQLCFTEVRWISTPVNYGDETIANLY